MGLLSEVRDFFGIDLNQKKGKKQKEFQTFVEPENQDGSLILTQKGGFTEGAFQGTFINFDSTAKTEFELIKHYREMAMHPDADAAIDDIVNEAIVSGEQKPSVSISLDSLPKVSKPIKNKIVECFDEILELLSFEKEGHDLFRKWYIDARLYHHIIVDEDKPKEGIQKLVPIDATTIKKIKIVDKKSIPMGPMPVEVVQKEQEFFQYTPINKDGLPGNPVQVAPEAISYAHSGLLDKTKKYVISHLHKAIKPLNQLKSVEDAVVIYRLTRAPERRAFYIDVGNLPKGKAEQYVNNIMNKHKNKMVYDAATGETQDQRNHLAMQEDFFLPRREGGKGTEIQSLQGGQNLGETEDVEYFKKKLSKALNVPVSRLETESGFNLGRSAEITRDEVKFTKFVGRLRNKFSVMFHNLLEVQLRTKGIITEQEWEQWKEHIQYDWNEDSHFTELKEAEILRERTQLLAEVDTYVGKYYSIEWVRKNILKQSEQDIKEIDKQIEQEREDGEVPEPEDFVTAQLGIPPEGEEGEFGDEPQDGDPSGPNPNGGPNVPQNPDDDDEQEEELQLNG